MIRLQRPYIVALAAGVLVALCWQTPWRSIAAHRPSLMWGDVPWQGWVAAIAGFAIGGFCVAAVLAGGWPTVFAFLTRRVPNLVPLLGAYGVALGITAVILGAIRAGVPPPDCVICASGGLGFQLGVLVREGWERRRAG